MKQPAQIQKDEYTYGFHDTEDIGAKPQKGLSEDVINMISDLKHEPDWMRQIRLHALNIFLEKPLPNWGADLSGIHFDDIYYYIKPKKKTERTWEDVPEDVKRTFDKLGIPEAERKFLAGVEAQYDSESVYSSLKNQWAELGVIFCSTDEAVREYPDLVKQYFGTVIPAGDNKFAALNTATWSGGSFVYVPKGVELKIPLQAYFRINAKAMGQFERTLIIAEEGSGVTYVEGCSAAMYSEDSLHAAVVEIIVKKGAKVRYTTIQNWSNNVYNLVTKRAMAYENAHMEWCDANIGSGVTMKYPSVFLMEPGARGEVLSMAFASKGQQLDTGAKMIHFAPNTSSLITSKSISKEDGRASYRGLVKVYPQATGAKVNVKCDALLLSKQSRSDTYPDMQIDNSQVSIQHEAVVSRVSEEQLFYAMSRGLKEDEAMALIVNGFIEPVAKLLPLEYAIELNRLIQLEMEGSVG